MIVGDERSMEQDDHRPIGVMVHDNVPRNGAVRGFGVTRPGLAK